ncbi:MAG: hypothetical protein ACI81S_001764 [Sphingobacteriales bacterium]|jgi:hypothetical protein
MKTILRKITKKMMAVVMVLSAIAIGFSSCSKDKNENGYKVRMTDSPGKFTAMQLEITNTGTLSYN